jgi:hypothetical protein
MTALAAALAAAALLVTLGGRLGDADPTRPGQMEGASS